MFDAQAVRVLIVSPGDVAQLRDVAARAVWDWNAAGHSKRLGVVAVPLRWEYDVATQQSLDGSDGQMLLNREMVDDADIVVAIFHTRLGTATPRALSGSAEEIERARQHNLGTHVFVSDAPVLRNMTPEQRTQLDALQAYERELQEQGLVGRFTTDTQLERGIRLALDHDIERVVQERTPVTPSTLADPPRWLEGLRDLERVYPSTVVEMASERIVRAFARQGGAIATSIEDAVTLSTSDMTGYVKYDVHRRTTFTWSHPPASAVVTVAVAPVLVARPGTPTLPTLAPGSERDRTPWAYQYWPQLDDAEDWATLSDRLGIELALAQSKNERASKLIKLRRTRRPSSPNPRQSGSPQHTAADIALTPVVLTGILELSEDWDIVDLRIRNLVHPLSMRAMHFYAGDFCTGTWDIAVTSNHPAVIARTTTVAGADVQMSTRRPTADLVYARIRATDVAVYPDDAIIISLSDRA